MSTRGSAVCTAENRVLLECLRECRNQLRDHALPRLKRWKSSLTAAVSMASHSLSTDAAPTRKRKRDVASTQREDDLDLAQVICPVSLDPRAQMQKVDQEANEALQKVVALESAIVTVLEGKCRELLDDTS